MKPLYLEMNAFGPYAGRQVIDFQQLGDRNFFLIYGPTGAGKTTILDAICYALYDDTSGHIRSGAAMRSEYATPEQMTYVRFDFAIGAKRYRVERQPEQTIAKKRGTGTKVEKASAALYEIHEDGTEKAVLSTKYVNGEIERLLGFKSDQFRQVVLLPQGDFRRLLLAGSADRQKIMQVLFRTERYGRFQELLKGKYDEIENSYAVIQERIEQSLNLAGADDEAALVQAQTAKAAQLEQVEAACKQALAERDAYQKVVQEAQALFSHWQALKASQKEMALLEQRTTEMQQKRAALDQLRKAKLLADPCAALEDILTQGSDRGRQAKEASLQAAKAGELLTRAEGEYHRLEEQEGAYKAHTAQLVQLRALLDKARSLAVLQLSYGQAEKKMGHLDMALQSLLKKKEECKDKIGKAGAVQEQLQELLVQSAQAKAAEQALQERLRQEQGIYDLEQHIASNRRKVAQAVKAGEEAVQQARRDKLDFDAVQAAYLQGQSALLAQNLAEGQPCPVCGAVHHPQLAEIPDNLPQKEDVQERRERAEKSEALRQERQIAIEKFSAALAEQEQRHKELRHTYGADGTLEDWRARLTAAGQRGQELAVKTEQCQKLVRQVQSWQKDIDGLEEEEKELRKKYDASRSDFAAAAAAKEQAEGEIPQAYRKDGALQQAVHELDHKVRAYEQALKKSRTVLAKAQQEAVRWQEQEKSLQRQVADLRQQYQEAYGKLKSRVEAAGFASVQECRSLQGSIDTIKAKEEEIASYDKSVQQASGRLTQEQAAVGTQPEPDMAAHGRILQEKNNRCSHLSEEGASLKSQYDRNAASLAQIASWRKEQADLSSRYKTVGAVYELVSGKNTGVNFERYVLGALLDDVLSAANQRLLKMSRSRYRMQRSHDWHDKRVKQIGLDIEIFDSYTGYARPANTLSGGETFLASLSLSLGLADVVQSYTGGIHLDTIFVDEGFGTLDSEALDYALKALLDLRQDGRLVGIISHVPELRERIDTRLAIRKTERGSTAAFEIL